MVYNTYTMAEFTKLPEPDQLSQSRIDEMYVNQFCFDTMAQNFAVLKLAVNTDDAELLELYTSHIVKHNADTEMAMFPNSGFDLFVPNETVFDRDFTAKFVDLKVRCEMIYCDKNMQVAIEGDDGETEQILGASYSSGYYVYPRSSISKTPLMLANHVGIIDSGYRGNIMAAVRKLPSDQSEYVVNKHTRLFQICHPSLCPVFVVLVPESELNSSERGEGGFGSTGITGTTK
jgi:dUTP pyrophosphatase